MKHVKLTTSQIAFLALATALNLVGGTIALALKLPFYLDTFGTLLAAFTMGPLYGMVPGLLSGIISGATTDVYAFFYLPVQMITGFFAGLLFHSEARRKQKALLPLYALCVTIPGTIVSSCITAFLFGGITSSGSSVIVQLLHGLGMDLTLSVFCVQVITDYIDRVLMIAAAQAAMVILPTVILSRIQRQHKT